MNDILEYCRKQLGPAPRTLTNAQKSALRVRLRGRMEHAFREARDPLLDLLKEQAIVRDRGQVVWGCVVQANDLLHQPGNPQTLPVHVIFSQDSYFDDHPHDLENIAGRLGQLKGSDNVEPALADVVRVITDEKERLFCRELPAAFCAGRSVYFTTCFFQPGHLPQWTIARRLIPMLVNPAATKFVSAVPYPFWPEPLVDEWGGRRSASPNPASSAHAADEDRISDPMDGLPPPRKAGLLQKLVSWIPAPKETGGPQMLHSWIQRKFGIPAGNSPERAQWEQRIARFPDNEELRLAFADWLTASGDPQGELIRISHEQEKLPADDPRYAALGKRWWQIFQASSASWLQPLKELGLEPYVGSYPVPVIWFEHGMITKTTIDRDGILPEQAERLFQAAPALQELEVLSGYVRSGHAGIQMVDYEIDWACMLSAPQLRQIRKLTLSSTAVREDDIRAIATSPNLVNLRELLMGSTEYGYEGILAIASSPFLKKLVNLHVGGFDFSEDGAKILAASANFAHLKELNISYAVIGPTGAQAIANSPHLSRLEVLFLSGNYITDAGLEALARSANLQKLTKLTLGSNMLTAKGLATLAQSANAANLISLSLDGNALAADSIRLLAASPQLARLKTLELQMNEIDDAGLRALVESPTIRGLAELQLGYNQISDAGIRILATSAGSSKLRKLDLSHNRITDAGVEMLASSERLANLEELNVRDNSLTPATAKTLIASKTLGKLKLLNVTREEIGTDGEKALRKKFGGAVICF